MKKIIVLLFLSIISLGVFAQNEDLRSMMRERNEFYFSFEVDDMHELAKIAQIISVDNVDGNKITAYANNKGYDNLMALGVETTLLTPPSMLENHKMFDGRTRAEYDWNEYPTYEAYVAMMEEFADTYSENCTLIELGTLDSGRKILLVRINNGETEGKPKFLYGSTIHGDETTGYIMMLRLIDLLLTQPDLPEVKNILDNIDLFVCPNANPDGTYRAGNHTVNGASRYNINGVDMNRNYPDPVDGPHPDGEDYAMETEMFMQLAEDYQFTMSAHYHGGAEVMNYPWDNTYERHADDAWWQMVCREYADLAQAAAQSTDPYYMTDEENGITNGADWYRIGGGRQDYMNYYRQCREVTIECSTTKCPPASQLPTFWEYNYNSIFAYMNQVLYGIHGTVKDAATQEPLEATIEILDHDQSYSIVETQLPMGNFHRPINAGTYTVEIKANGYLPVQKTVTVVDGETTILNVELEEGDGLIPDFTASATMVGIGANVQFTDESWGSGIVDWNWSFEGGEPATSTVQNPTVKYNEAGTFSVTLTVTNDDGEMETITKRNYITAMESYILHDAVITTCEALFFDSGGPAGNYPDNDFGVITFKPATEGAMIQVEFLEFSTEENYDIIRVYDGITVGESPCLAELSGNVIPEKYTASNPYGALTFRFLSDFGYNYPGWKAVIRCIGGDMNVTAEASLDTICLGESVSLYAEVSGGSGEYTYSWSPAEMMDNPNAQNPVATPTESGEITFTLEVSDGSNTEEIDVVVFVNDCVNVEEKTVNNVEIYPNPAKDVVYVVLGDSSENVSWTLVNMQGQIVKQMENVSGNFEIELEDVNKGIFFLNVLVGDKPMIKKIVVE